MKTRMRFMSFFIWMTPLAHPAQANEVSVAEARTAALRLPVYFEQNRGQVSGSAPFLSHHGGTQIGLSGGELTFILEGSTEPVKAPLGFPEAVPTQPAARAELRMRLVGANPAAKGQGLDPLPGKSHYFLGNRADRWQRNVPHYARVQFQEVYPGMDLIYYGSEGSLEYDFVVAPGADPARIQLAFEGARRVELLPDGDLRLQTDWGEVRHKKPFLYQVVNGQRREVKGRYVLMGRNRVRFALGRYDKRLPLVIDPVVLYATRISGNVVSDVAADHQGHAYLLSNSSAGVKVMKVHVATNTVVYEAVIGGSAVQSGSKIALDASRNAYVIGSTTSANFPTRNAFQNSLQGGFDVFVFKLNFTGSSLLYSTYLGGSADDTGLGLAVDSFGNAFLTGRTFSANFPTAAPSGSTVFQSSRRGTNDAFVTKLNPSGAFLTYSTYLGGGASDIGTAIALDGIGQAHVVGTSTSNNFPTRRAFSGGTLLLGDSDAFLSKFSTDGSELLYSTLFGGGTIDQLPSSDSAEGVAVDNNGHVYVVGATDTGTSFPTKNAFQSGPGGDWDAFLAKFDPAQSGNSSLLYSSRLGGSDSDGFEDVVLDSDNTAIAVGSSHSDDFPTRNPMQTNRPGADVVLAKFNPALSGNNSLIYSSYLGGSGEDFGRAIARNSSGSLFLVGGTHSNDFPVSLCPLFPSGFGLLVEVVDALPVIDLAVSLTDEPDPLDRCGVLLYTITVQNLSGLTARDVQVSLIMPSTANWALVPGGSDCPYQSQGNLFFCTPCSLLPGETRVLQVRVRPLVTGTFSVIAQVDGRVNDPVNTNNLAFASTTIPNAPSGVFGRVSFQNFVGPLAGRQVTFRVHHPGSQTVLEQHTVVLGADGGYSFASGLTGAKEISLKTGTFLRRRLSISNLSGCIQVNFSLTNGDVNNDNRVDDADLLAVLFGFGLTGSNLPEDLDGNGTVNDGDLLIVLFNFGAVGDP